MQWDVKTSIPDGSSQERRKAIIRAILKNRGIKGKRQILDFTQPQKPETLDPQKVGISKVQQNLALKRVKRAIVNLEHIVVYGDYDADGICATAALWETLHALGADALPFIPHREKQGYGLSIKGIQEILKHPKPYTLNPIPSLIITVDNGIVAHGAVDFANKKGIDVIICDHHEKAKKLPKANAIIHTTKLSGTGVAWVFAKELVKHLKPSKASSISHSTLDVATIGTVADMVPVLDANRSIVKHGLEVLRNTKRLGVMTLLSEAQRTPAEIDTYQINFIIAPRLNAMGRLEHALDALRLLCTKDPKRARFLADAIGTTNRRRQQMTEEMLSRAKSLAQTDDSGRIKDKIIIIDREEFHEGIIGLIAGKIVEEFYRPTIVFARGKKISKASARSIAGFNIIEAIRKMEHLLVDAGGHPMAAGFTIESVNIDKFIRSMQKIADEVLTDKLLEPKLTLDAQIFMKDITWELYEQLERMAPFGIGNPMPKFALKDVRVLSARAVGKEKNHLKLTVAQDQVTLDAIAFHLGDMTEVIRADDHIDLAASLEKNAWNGKKRLELRVKDLLMDELPGRGL